MKAEYDFSKGERGNSYHYDAVFRFPLYLEVQILVNEWLRADIKRSASKLSDRHWFCGPISGSSQCDRT